MLRSQPVLVLFLGRDCGSGHDKGEVVPRWVCVFLISDGPRSTTVQVREGVSRPSFGNDLGEGFSRLLKGVLREVYT